MNDSSTSSDKVLKFVPAPERPRYYQFGPFCLDTVDQQVFRNGEVVPLPPKTIETLLLLLQLVMKEGADEHSHFRSALEQEPRYALAWPGLAQVLKLLGVPRGDVREDNHVRLWAWRNLQRIEHLAVRRGAARPGAGDDDRSSDELPPKLVGIDEMKGQH